MNLQEAYELMFELTGNEHISNICSYHLRSIMDLLSIMKIDPVYRGILQVAIATEILSAFHSGEESERGN